MTRRRDRDMSVPDDELVCRICLEVENDPNSPLDQLFRPCLCKGTMAYVHGRCLDEWRRASVKRSSKYQCDQCHYEYNISRLGSPHAVRVAKLLKTPWFTPLLSIWLVFFIIYVSGVVARLWRGGLLVGVVSSLGEEPGFLELERELPPQEFIEETNWAMAELLGSVLWDMCDGAIYVGGLSFACSCASWLFIQGAPGGGAGLRSYNLFGGGGSNRDKDCCKALVLIVILIGLYIAFNFVHTHASELIQSTVGRAANAVIDIRDVEEEAIVEGRGKPGWQRHVYTALATLVLAFVVLTTLTLSCTIIATIWVKLEASPKTGTRQP